MTGLAQGDGDAFADTLSDDSLRIINAEESKGVTKIYLLSSRIVTGPSFTIATSIIARKTPVWTRE